MQRRSELVSVCVANDDNVSVIRWYNNRIVSIHDDFRSTRFNNNNIGNSYATPRAVRVPLTNITIFLNVYTNPPRTWYRPFLASHIKSKTYIQITHEKIQNSQINRGREMYYYLSVRCSDDCQCMWSGKKIKNKNIKTKKTVEKTALKISIHKLVSKC